MAALAGIAEEGTNGDNKDIMDNFLVHKKNDAGCYPIIMHVNGEDVVVVVDEWFPFYIDHEGEEQFCFARMTPDKDPITGAPTKGELWV